MQGAHCASFLLQVRIKQRVLGKRPYKKSAKNYLFPLAVCPKLCYNVCIYVRKDWII